MPRGRFQYPRNVKMNISLTVKIAQRALCICRVIAMWLAQAAPGNVELTS